MATDWFLDGERKEYQEDSFKWLHKRLAGITERINAQAKWQANETKSFVQNAAELHNKSLAATRESLIFCVAVIVMIALASAGVWIGVGGVALFLVVQRCWSMYVERLGYRLDRFRERYRRVLAAIERHDMLPEDKEFIRKYEDSILYPLAVANEWTGAYRLGEHLVWHQYGRETVSAGDLEHIESLYQEYCGGSVWGHPHDLDKPQENCTECKLGVGARRVREHIDGVLSKFDDEIKKWREALTAQIDGSNPEGAILTKEFSEDLRDWWPFDAGTEMRTLVEWLLDKDHWTFDQADKVRDLCKAEESVQSELRSKDINQHYESEPPAWKQPVWKVYVKLSREMGAAAARAGLWDVWKHYEAGENFLAQNEKAIKDVRRVIGRHNPETMFRELAFAGFFAINWALRPLKNYGYDGQLVIREIETARKLMAKERRELDMCFEKESAAAQAFASAEEAVRHRRNNELSEASGREKPSLPLRSARAVGKLIRKLFGVERFLSGAHPTFEGWLLEITVVGLFVGGIGLGVVGETVERVRGIHFPVDVAVIPVLMICASFFFDALTHEGLKTKLKAIWIVAIWTVGLLSFFYWFRMR